MKLGIGELIILVGAIGVVLGIVVVIIVTRKKKKD